MDKIKYGTGAIDIGGSLADVPKSALSEGYVDVTAKKPSDPWEPGYEHCDDDGTNYVGSIYERRNTGACGRPDGNER
jgi:hypothetical protein